MAGADPFAVHNSIPALPATEAVKWANHGFTDADAKTWSASGANAYQASEYRDAGFTPEQTAEWMKVPDGLPALPPTGPMARRWAECPIYHDGITPADAHAWRAAGIETPDAASEAFAWADRLGYLDNANEGQWVAEDGPYDAVVQASVWAKARFTPKEQAAWQTAGFTFDDGRGPVTASVWRDHIADPDRAAQWRRTVGNNPGTALAAALAGITPEDYRAGRLDP